MQSCASCNRTALAPHFPKLRIAAVAATVITVLALAILLSPLVAVGTIAFIATAATLGVLAAAAITLFVLALLARPAAKKDDAESPKVSTNSVDMTQAVSAQDRRQFLADLAAKDNMSDAFKKFVTILGKISSAAEQNQTVSILNKSTDAQWNDIVQDLTTISLDPNFEHTKDYLESKAFTNAFSNVLGEVEKALIQ